MTQRESSLTTELRKHGVDWKLAPIPDVLDIHDEGVLEYGVAGKLRSALAVAEYNRSIAALIRGHGIDVVIARGLKGVLLTGLAARWQGASLIWDIGVEKESRGGLWLLHCAALLLSNRVVVQADALAPQVFGSVISRLCWKKIETIYPGIEDDRRRQIESAVTEDWGSKRIDAISIGSIHPRKDQLMLIRAVERAVRSIPDLAVVIVGSVRDEAYFRRVKQEVRDYGLEAHVSFMGWRDDIPELLARSRIVVITSTREGVPYVVREAMYAGLPVVGTEVGGMSEAVEDGVTGFLVTWGDADGLGDRMVRLLKDPDLRARMGQAGSRHVRRRFSRERFGARYRDLINDLR